MFNLLPDNLKDVIQSDYKQRRLTLVLVFVIFLQISGLIFLFPSWLISVYRENEAIADTAQMNKSSLVSDLNSTAGAIAGTNGKLKLLSTVLEYPTLTHFVDAILSQKTDNIKIGGIHYVSTSKTTATISISGIANTRESLVTFVKNLQDSKVFESVDLPVSNLAKDNDINFSINLTVGAMPQATQTQDQNANQ